MAIQGYQLDPTRKWTDAQRAGVLDRSGSTIVSAAAGTGKTSVLTERCVSLVAGTEAIDIDKLLVVTFTEAAALEMRGRIREALAKLQEKTGRSRLMHQLMLLDAAPISTLHSFCLQVVRENFSTAGIDPDAGVLDDDEAQLLKDDVLDGLFDRLYNSQDQRGKQFVQFVASYGQGQDQAIREHVKHLHEYLRSLPPTQRDGWKQRAVTAYSLDKDGVLTAEQFNRLRQAMGEELDILLECARSQLDAFQAQVGPHRMLDNGQSVYACLLSLRQQLEHVESSTSLLKWKEAACISPWKTLRAPELSASCKAWAKWLHDHWMKGFNDRWLTSTEAWSYGLRIAGGYAELLIWLVNQFEQAYSRTRRQIGKIDYSDMEEHAFQLLASEDGSPSQIARAYQQRYASVLVDEFQDINPIQAAILRLVSRESADPPQPNMFTVGDVKQSIYGFRMTDPGEFLQRQRVVAEGGMAGRSITLQENFRSQPEVLKAINRVFGKLMRADETAVQYDESAELKPGRAEYAAASGPAVELHILDGSKGHAEPSEPQPDVEDAAEDTIEEMQDRQKEAYLIARRIRQLIGAEFQDGGKLGRLQYRHMVILLRGTQTTAEVYTNVLRQCGIPVYAELRSGYFASREIKDMLSLLAVLENMQQDIPLAAVLRSPLFGEALCDADLANLRIARQDLDFHQTVRWYAESGPDAALRHKVGQHMDRLERWRAEAQVRPLAEVIASIYQATGLLEYATLLSDGMQCRANLLSLYERARQFGQFSRQGLRRFVTFVHEMIKSGRETGTPTAVNEAQDVVRIMSIHASKGLEFPVVFLADLARKFNDRDFNSSVVLDREGTLGIEARDPQRMLRSDTLVKLLASRKVRQQNRAEELRVLYVAMTRARERLILVGTRKKDPVGWLEEQRQLWGAWQGQLPRYLVRYASCPLEWLIPALAAKESPDSPHLFDWKEVQPDTSDGNGTYTSASSPAVFVYPANTIDTWRIVNPSGHYNSAQILAELPGPEVPPSPGATQTIARLTGTYRYDRLTRIPAITPVTELKGRLSWGEPDEEEPSYAPPQHRAPGGGGFDVPRRLRPAGSGDAARKRGTATHLLLQKIDLRGKSDPATLREELADLVRRRLLSSAEAEQIDLDGVDWFLNQTLPGKALRANSEYVLREMPFIMRLAPQRLAPGSGSDDLADAGIVRGVIDVLWSTPEGIEIADFKTDAVQGSELRRRIEFYQDQLQMYAWAIQQIWHKPVSRLWLIFLHPRHIEPFAPKALKG
jgi:ATP-dependent helicase/nuclease subunit A